MTYNKKNILFYIKKLKLKKFLMDEKDHKIVFIINRPGLDFWPGSRFKSMKRVGISRDLESGRSLVFAGLKHHKLLKITFFVEILYFYQHNTLNYVHYTFN